jgi:hypothetical protein
MESKIRPAEAWSTEQDHSQLAGGEESRRRANEIDFLIPSRHHMAIPSVIRRHVVTTVVAIVIILPAAVFTIWTEAALHFSYSRGERAGFLQKISQRGWLCKTWEGELQLSAIPGSAPEKFLFTTRNDSVATVLNQMNGQHVVLNYEQHKGLPGSCYGETEYFVTGARAVGTP